MTGIIEEEFIRLVEQSEKAAKENMGAYKVKLALFATLGYVVIFLVVGVLALLIGGTVGIALVSSSLFLLLIKKKVIFVIIFAIWTFLKALWVRLEAPQGYTATPEEYPELFSEINQLTKELDALKIHQVIVENTLNAAVVQTPRFGVFGAQKNTLILGLQLLLALSPQEMRSVLAHEFGHLSGNHSRFSGWIYRVRLTWYRVMAAFDESDSFGASIMRKFFDWYAPKFAAYSFALARENEYEADKVAAELTSPETAAKALINIHAKAPYIDNEFWDVYFKKADEFPSPPSPPFESLADFLKISPITREKLLELIKEEMRVETHYADTHPALRDRVENITSELVIPDTIDQNAAEAWLGSRYPILLKYFDDTWLNENEGRWKGRYEYVAQAKTALEKFKTQDRSELNDDDLYSLAHYQLEFETKDAALATFQEFKERHPESVGASLYIGQILCEKDDPTALDHLTVALTNPNTFQDAAYLGFSLIHRLENKDLETKWQEDTQQASDRLNKIYAERSNILENDSFEVPEIEDALKEEITRKLSSHKGVKKAWITQKVLQHKDFSPVYIIAFKPKGFHLSVDSLMQSVAEALNVEEEFFVACFSGDTKAMAKKVKKEGIQLI